MSAGCTASLGLAGAVHDCDWTEPHPGHAHHNHQAGATWTGATWRDLTTLRAEVGRLIDAIRTELRDSRFDYDDYSEPLAIGTGQILAYSRVLDLIDKHAREGQ